LEHQDQIAHHVLTLEHQPKAETAVHATFLETPILCVTTLFFILVHQQGVLGATRQLADGITA
jgi:hypothetical protein